MAPLFIYFDGDDVGARIELALIDDDPAAAAAASELVSTAVRELADDIAMLADGNVLFAAGDEVFAVVPARTPLDRLERMRSRFKETSGLSLSCGIGASSQEAALHLRLAKLRGKDQVAGASGG